MPQRFNVNTEMFMKRGLSVFWWWLCRDVLRHLERLLEKFVRPLRFTKRP